jgi:1-acyl-sn-glycerol-3-phosphate acyltransferase
MGFDYEIYNREILDETKPAVIVGNHQHNFDIMLAGKLFNYKTVSLGKRQLGFLPLFGQVFWLAGNVLITRGSKQSAMKTMKQVESYLRSHGLGMVIFPEGHRNASDELLPFKKGAFHTAINCQIPLVIFVVSQYAKSMQLNRWKAGKMVVKILPPINTEGLSEKDIPRLMQEVREKMQEGIREVNQLAEI